MRHSNLQITTRDPRRWVRTRSQKIAGQVLARLDEAEGSDASEP